MMHVDSQPGNDDFEEWNGILCPIEAVTRLGGIEAAEALWREFGGIRVYFPKRLTVDHPLIRTLGTEVATALCEELNVLTLVVPLHPKSVFREVVRRFASENRSAAECARYLGIAERRIYRIRKEIGIKSAK